MQGKEQVPIYSVNQVDDGLEEEIHIVVRLPGVQSASEFVVSIQPQCFLLHVPGRYILVTNRRSKYTLQPLYRRNTLCPANSLIH